MELRRNGVPIRLQEQPLQVLATLVERPGEIITREELQERFWGKDTFVDFEQSLNKAVNRLREALNDEAGQPKYVETVPRRGYRFIAPVIGLPMEQPTAAADSSFRGSSWLSLALHRKRIVSMSLLAAFLGGSSQDRQLFIGETSGEDPAGGNQTHGFGNHRLAPRFRAMASCSLTDPTPALASSMFGCSKPRGGQAIQGHPRVLRGI